MNENPVQAQAGSHSSGTTDYCRYGLICIVYEVLRTDYTARRLALGFQIPMLWRHGILELPVFSPHFLGATFPSQSTLP